MSEIGRIVVILLLLAGGRFLATGPRRQEQNRLQEAQIQRLAGNFGSARELIESAPGVKSTDALYDLALTRIREAESLREEGNVEAANEATRAAAVHLETIVRTEPALQEARNDLGVIYGRLGRYDEAIVQLAGLPRGTDPQSLVYQRNLADVYAAARRPEEALQHYADVLAAQPYDRTTLDALLELRLETTPAAAQMLTRARANDGPFGIAAPVAVLRAGTGLLEATAMLDLTRHLTLRLPATALDILRADTEAIPERHSAFRADIARVLSDNPLPATGSYSWLRPSEDTEETAAFRNLLFARARRAAADGSAALAAALAEEALRWARRPLDGEAAAQAVDFALNAGDRSRIHGIVDRVRSSHPEGTPPTRDAYLFHRVAAIAYAELGAWDPCADPWHAAPFHLDAERRLATLRTPVEPSLEVLRAKAPAPHNCEGTTTPEETKKTDIDETKKTDIDETKKTDADEAKKTDTDNKKKIDTDETKKKTDTERAADSDLQAAIDRLLLRIDSVVTHFDSDSAVLKEEAELFDLAQLLAKSGRIVRIAGHADSTASREHNQPLSESRAIAVQIFLEKHGVPLARTSVRGHGEDAPVATNQTTAGRARNRRVTITIVR